MRQAQADLTAAQQLQAQQDLVDANQTYFKLAEFRYEQGVDSYLTRLDAQRSTPGSGLGLSLVEAVAKLHDARLELGDNVPGLKVTLSFRPAPAEEIEQVALALAS